MSAGAIHRSMARGVFVLAFFLLGLSMVAGEQMSHELPPMPEETTKEIATAPVVIDGVFKWCDPRRRCILCYTETVCDRRRGKCRSPRSDSGVLRGRYLQVTTRIGGLNRSSRSKLPS